MKYDCFRCPPSGPKPGEIETRSTLYPKAKFYLRPLFLGFLSWLGWQGAFIAVVRFDRTEALATGLTSGEIDQHLFEVHDIGRVERTWGYA